MLFNKMEEVKVLVRENPWLWLRVSSGSRHGFRLYRPIQLLIGLNRWQTPVTFALSRNAQGLKVIGSSE